MTNFRLSIVRPAVIGNDGDHTLHGKTGTPFWRSRPSFGNFRAPVFFTLSLFWLFLSGALCGRRHPSVPHALSFYYWRTHFRLSDTERTALRDNGVKTLYTRYFDMDFAPEDTAPKPLAPIIFPNPSATAGLVTGRSVTAGASNGAVSEGKIRSKDNPSDSLQIVPVIFIRNRVFERLDTPGVHRLAERVLSLSAAISATGHIQSFSTQFDCDWTEKTKDRYFLFISDYRTLSHQPVSATIRLHQVKYPDRTGVPPVDRGVLMYYNMGNINAGEQRSIYDKSIADKYIPSLKTYPLKLDIALPIFTWGLLIRQDKVIQLLEKMDFSVFEKDSTFRALKKDRYQVRQSGFKGGYYFRENDEVKIENVGTQELEDIISQVNSYSNHRIGDLIFYDLDASNLLRYEKNSFQKIRDLTD